MRFAIFVFAGLAAIACDSRRYVYEPAVNTNAVVSGRPASYYAIPPQSPRGDVRIASLGLVDIRPTEGEDEVRAIHLRMVVANNSSDVPWSLDTREQRVTLPRDGESRPAYSTVDGGSPPLVSIPKGEKRSIDLFYPLPPGMQEAEELPSFDTIWRVHTSEGAVVERTPFERLDITPVYRPYPYGYSYWGPPYWYDPWYGRGGAFVGVRLSPGYVDRPVVIDRHPTRPPPARRVR